MKRNCVRIVKLYKFDKKMKRFMCLTPTERAIAFFLVQFPNSNCGSVSLTHHEGHSSQHPIHLTSPIAHNLINI